MGVGRWKAGFGWENGFFLVVFAFAFALALFPVVFGERCGAKGMLGMCG